MNIKIAFNKIFSKNAFIIASVFYCTAKRLPYLGGYSILTYIMSAYAVIIFVKTRLFDYKELKFPSSIFAYGIVAMTIISSFINGIPDKRQFIVDLIPICVSLLVIFPTYSYDTTNNIYSFLKKFFLLLLIISFVISLTNMSLYVANIFNATNEIINSTRMIGILGNPNIVGWFSIVGIGTGIFINIFKNEFSKVIYVFNIVSLVLSLICVIISQCRGALLGLCISIPFVLLLNQKVYSFFIKKPVKYFSTFLFLLIVCFIIMMLMGKRFGSGREDIYRFVIEEYLKYNKLIGVGISNVRSVWLGDYDFLVKNNLYNGNMDIASYIAMGNSHNIPLFFLATTGIIGFILVVGLIFSIIKAIFMFLKSSKLFSDVEFKIIIVLIYFTLSDLTIGMVDNSIIISQVLFTNLLFCFCSGLLLRMVLNERIGK